MALYMVIEHFRSRYLKPVYRSLRENGRMMSAGLNYTKSWIDMSNRRCCQVMETDDASLMNIWIENWKDLVDFEIHEVMTSAEAAERAPKIVSSE